VGIGFELRTTYSDTMINYQLSNSEKLKLLGNDKFNHLTIILTVSSINIFDKPRFFFFFIFYFIFLFL
jgi:hypothetical protein